MRSYRIAYFTADCNYELVESTLQGLKQYVEDHPQVSLCVFDCFGTSRDATSNIPGYSIFDLADLDAFDGLLVQGNQIIPAEIRDHISRMVLQSRIPAVSVDCPIEGCKLIGLDNRRAQMEITEHLIRDHQARKLVYLTGNLNNSSPNAPLRVEGFYDACGRYGIGREDTEVIPCAWQTCDGARVGRLWVEDKRALPDAFVCANDEMAIGLIEALSSGGIRVPQDVLVTGFDHISSSELSDPSISTVHRDFGATNYQAADALIRMIGGEEIPDKGTYPYSLVLSESCGCPARHDLGKIKNRSFHRLRFLQSFNSLQDRLSEDLVRTSSLADLMRLFRERSGLFGCEHVYLCVNDFYYDRYGLAGAGTPASAFGEEMVMLKENGDGQDPSFFRFPSKMLLPGDILSRDRFMIFYPLHSDTGSIGYLAMNGISEVTRLNLHQSLLNFLEISIENVQKKELLHQLNDRLDHLYVHDELTGLYNRFGLERYGETLFRRLLKDGKGVQLLFVDLDGLKGINDEFGHDFGDKAILCAAQALTDALGEDSFLMRYGGDEFLIIAPREDGGYPERIRNAVDGHQELPFPLSLSIGIRQVTGEGNRSMAEWIRDADQVMYEEKRKKKARYQSRAR